MDISFTRNASVFAAYPFLTSEEFTEVCHYLDSAYRRAQLGEQRRKWQLEVVLQTEYAPLGLDFGDSTYIKIQRLLEPDAADVSLSMGLQQLNFLERGTENESDDLMNDADMLEAEDADQATLPRRAARLSPYVKYEIHLHPTYRAPCLWFSLHELPDNEAPLSLDTVFRRLVPDHFKDGLRRTGPIGGISIDNHPITGAPSFFIHPCLLGEAMSSFDCSKENYLMTWLGLVGGCVSLWVPKGMALVLGQS